MKKIINIFASLAVMVFASSCGKDFVTAIHNSAEPVDEYFISEERLTQSLVAAYNPLNWLDYAWGYTPLMFVSDIMADDIYCGGSDENDQLSLSTTHLYKIAANNQCSSLWTALYSGINRCCVVIEHLDVAKGVDQDTKDLYKAECLVLKAFYYNILWKLWGNIPYYDVNLTAPYKAPQLAADDVYKNMVEKLEEAIDMKVLPAKAAAGNEGRMTQDMAYMLFAEMVMYQNDNTRYQTALNYMEEIIGSHRYDLVDDFAGMWEVSGEWCKESIWEINFTSVGSVRGWSNMLASGGHVYGTLIGINGYKGSDNWYSGWGFGPVAQSAWDMYEAGDIRRDASILNLQGEPDSYSPRWQDTGLFQRKYIGRKDGTAGALSDADCNQNSNFRIYRFAETLLNAAELSLLVNGTANTSYLQRVRNRAHCTDTGATQVDIIEERHKEFVSEGKRYWDLVRTGLASTVLKAANHEYRQYDWTPDIKYWPLPQSDVDKDEALKQNSYPQR